MKKNWFYILVSLTAGARHGRAIMRDVLELTDGSVRLWPAALYGSLDELRERGLIEELSDPELRPEGQSERKRYYGITTAGRLAVAAETDRLAGLVHTARSRMREA
jgi:DNA-binding PadR family transcriptional regulator